ncbi:MAG TPA: EAL domain-containing protein, partial [Geminicoccaceae bacterium]
GELVVGMICTAQDITELRRIEARLTAQQQERRALIELTDGVVLIIDGDGRLRDVAGELPGELARRLRASIGRLLDDVLGDETGRVWREQARGVLPGWPPVRFTFDFPTSLGEEHYQVALAPGTTRTVIAVLRPQTAALRLVPALSAGENGDPRLRALIGSLIEPTLLLAPDFRIQIMNQAVERLLGWPRERTQDSYFPSLLAGADESSPVLDDLARALAGSPVTGSETWVHLPGGQEGRVLWSFRPLEGEGGEVVAILAQGQPLAPLGSGLPAPADGQQRLDLIIDHIADGVVTLTPDGAIVGFSRSAEAIFGYAQSEIIGSRIDRLMSPGGAEALDTLAAILAVARQPGEVRDLAGRRKSGEPIPIEVAASEIRSNGDRLYILTVRDVMLRRQTEETIRSLAYHDPLTGLPNRLLFNDRLAQAIERARRNKQVLSVMILDLDRFKLINDSLGLASGDRVLRRIGERLARVIRRSDTVARLGGDDFLLLLPAVRSAEGAAKVAQKLLDTVKPLLQINGQELHVGASIGIALYPYDGENTETLVRNADTALYRAKERSRGSYQFYTTDMNATAFERLMLETQLRKAIENNELMVQYQPQVRIDTGKVVGVEALVRWRHPELGMISPGEFIPLAEETGLIAAIGRFVLATACAEVQKWRDTGLRDLRLAVNLSGRQFQEPDLVELIAEVLRVTGFAPEDLELELTESSIMQDAEATIGKLEALNRLGIRLSIDDFGTGYSSLNYLKRFPIKALKIDQSFIQDITTDPNDAAIAQAIIALAESMKLRVIAEGVETRQQLELLRRYRCDEMQGYLFSRPLPPDELLVFLKERGRMLN